MAYPYWLDQNGRPRDEGIPFSQHVRDFYQHRSMQVMRIHRAYLSKHKPVKKTQFISHAAQLRVLPVHMLGPQRLKANPQKRTNPQAFRRDLAKEFPWSTMKSEGLQNER